MIGSDTRSGENGKIGGADPGARSDTVMVVHISPGRHSVVVLSFPRDSVVPVLQCAPEDGTTGQQAEPGQVEQLNSTFAYGGPGCLWHTIEQTTHIRINDFLELTFVGFEKVINGIGGVNVCLPYSVDDPMSGLHLPAGRHHIYGSQALAFWRTREDLGQGSDLQRIERDQLLMVALLHGIEKNNLLKNKTKMLDVLTNTARADAITMDSGMTTGKVLEIAQSLDGLSPKSVQFVEVPVVTYPLNDNWVQWAPQDNGLFAAIAHNSKLPKAAPKKPGTAPVLDSVSPASVKVEVLNGTETGGLAGTTGTGLSSAGFDVLGESDADNADYTSSVIEYRTAAALPAARTLEARLGDVILRKTSTVPRGTIDLIIGSSFTGLKSASKTPARHLKQPGKEAVSVSRRRARPRGRPARVIRQTVRTDIGCRGPGSIRQPSAKPDSQALRAPADRSRAAVIAIQSSRYIPASGHGRFLRASSTRFRPSSRCHVSCRAFGTAGWHIRAAASYSSR